MVLSDIDAASRPTLVMVAATLRERSDRLREGGIDRIIVFGSVARGEDRPDSDVDLLLVPRDSLAVSGLRLAGWRVLLSEILGRDADAVIEDFLRDSVRSSVEAEGVEVFRW
jgi:predicted nucleotidyltransferase